MKVLHCITGLNTGGAEVMLCKLLSRLPALGVECRVVSLLPPGPMAQRLRDSGIQVDSLHMCRGMPSLRGVFRLVSLIRSWRPDVIQTWLYHADLLGLLAAKLCGSVPVIWNIRCSYMDLNQYSRMTSLVLKLCSRFSHLPYAILTNSEEARRFHQELGYRAKSFRVIPNGFDTTLFCPDSKARRRLKEKLDLDENGILIGLVARFDPMKDHSTFFKAARKTLLRHPRTRFLLCGEGISSDNPEIMRMVHENDLEESVLLLGPREDTPSIMASLDMAVCCSMGESFPNVVGEAMACGTPCVVTDVGDSAQIVGDTGLVVPPKNAPALAEALCSLLDKGKPYYQDLGEAARTRIISLYSLEKIVSMYYDIYTNFPDTHQ